MNGSKMRISGVLLSFVLSQACGSVFGDKQSFSSSTPGAKNVEVTFNEMNSRPAPEVLPGSGSPTDDGGPLETGAASPGEEPKNSGERKNTEKAHKVSDKEKPLMSSMSKVDENIQGECAKSLGISMEKVKVAGRNRQLNLETSDALAIKVTGSHAAVRIALKAGSEPNHSISGICLFVAGNEAEIIIDIGTDVGTLHYKGRGNHSSTNIRVGELGKLRTIKANLAGNSPKLSISGKGNIGCENAEKVLHGNNPVFECIK